MVLVVCTSLAMGRLCVHDFLWYDDERTVHQNGRLQPPTLQTLTYYWSKPAYGLYIPVTYTVWAGVAAVAHVPKDPYGIALNPWLFHSTNFLFHLLAVLVAYRILRLLNIGSFASMCGALLFGVHPIQVEAVGWVSGLKDVLSGFLALVALCQYVASTRPDLTKRWSGLRYALATVAFVLALLAKPAVMALPLAALALDRWVIGRPWRKAVAGMIPWVCLALPIAIVARYVQEASYVWMPSIWLRPLIALDAIAFYIGKLIWPLNLAVDYGRSPTAVLHHGWCFWTWLVPVSIAIVLISGHQRRPVLLAAGVLFAAGCLPVLGLSPAQFQIYSTTADHYLYLSMLGPALAFSWIISRWPSAMTRIIACAALVCLIALSVMQGSYWQNDFTLFLHDTKVNPQSFMGYYNLGEFYERAEQPVLAIAEFKKATEVDPDWFFSWHELAAAYANDGQLELAIQAARRSVELQIRDRTERLTWFKDNEMLGRLLFQEGRFKDSIPYLQTVSKLRPDSSQLAQQLLEAKRRAATQATTLKTPSIPALTP